MTRDLEQTLEQLATVFGAKLIESDANRIPYFEIRAEDSEPLLGLLKKDEHDMINAKTPAFAQYARTPIIIPVTPDTNAQRYFAAQGSEAARDQGWGPERLDEDQYAIGTAALRGPLDLGAYEHHNGLVVPTRLAGMITPEGDASQADLPIIYAFPMESTIARIDTKLDKKRALVDTKVSYPEFGR